MAQFYSEKTRHLLMVNLWFAFMLLASYFLVFGSHSPLTTLLSSFSGLATYLLLNPNALSEPIRYKKTRLKEAGTVTFWLVVVVLLLWGLFEMLNYFEISSTKFLGVVIFLSSCHFYIKQVLVKSAK